MSSDRPRRRLPEHLARLAQRLGHSFEDPGLLIDALTHASKRGEVGRSYERLEFLGDRVIGLLVAEMLYRRFPREAEGALAKRHAMLVRRDTLARVALGLELAAAISLSPGEAVSGGRENPAILADACEAVIGALYLDGGIEAARRLVEAEWAPLLALDVRPPQDAKTALQEWAQARGLPLPSYAEISRSGPPHHPLFTVEVAVEGEPAAEGVGRSKRQAEQQAARRLLSRLAGGGR